MTYLQGIVGDVHLWCKPLSNKASGTILFTKQYTDWNDPVLFRSLDLETDLYMIHSWMNQAYSQKFWQLNGAIDMVRSTYKGVLDKKHAHSYIGMMGDRPICLIDLYAVEADELKDHVDAKAGDCGLHLLMCPPREMQKGWSLLALRAFADFYFSFPQMNNLYAEPDIENSAANQLALKAGFKFIKEIRLAYKSAKLYSMDRKSYNCDNP